MKSPQLRLRAPLLAVMLSFACTGQEAASAASPPLAPQALDSYITRTARAWELLTAESGHVLDPLNAADSGDNYGVLQLADVMLRAASRDDDPRLAETGERIVRAAARLSQLEGPFNLLAVAALLRDGRLGRFGPLVWSRLATLVTAMAERIAPPGRGGCWTTPGCYTNWRLVWAAGASQLLAAGIVPRTAAGDSLAAARREIQTDLDLAVRSAGAPADPSPLSGARELSDPASEPPSYAAFSCALLELVAEAEPGAMTPRVESLREAAAKYVLQLMAPDGQLSYAGRSLDQSWVQSAGALLGARQALADPARAGMWRSFADRAATYLLNDYPGLPDGIVPIVPGLLLDWSPSIMDGYAALDQYEGLTLWFLSRALDTWPSPTATRAPRPADAPDFLVGDLRSSGLVWGRAGPIWWTLSGHSTARDSRSTQGLVAVKFETGEGWRELTALRPIGDGEASVWTLRLPDGQEAAPIFTAVHGTGRHALLTGSYWRRDGRRIGPVSWRLTATRLGVQLAMSKPEQSALRTDVWLAAHGATLRSDGAHASRQRCAVSASGASCAVDLTWQDGPEAALTLEALPGGA